MARGVAVGVLAVVAAGCGVGGSGAARPAPLTVTTAPAVAGAVRVGMESASTALFLTRAAGRGAFRGGNLLIQASDQLGIELDADGDGIAEQFLPVQLVDGEYLPRPT